MKKLSKQITLGLDPYTGKRIRKRIYADTKLGLKQAEKDAMIQFSESNNPSDVKLGKYADDWLTAYKSMREAATINMYETAIKKLQPLSQKKVRQITQMDLQILINQHMEHPRACEQLTLTLNQIFKRAVKDGIIKRNPADDLEVPEHESAEGRAITAEEVKAINAADLDDMERIYVKLLYYFGLRPQEAFALMPTDFDFKSGEVIIRKAIGFDKNHPYMKSTKTRKGRRIPIPNVFLPDIKKYLSKLKKQSSLYLLHRDGQIMTKSERHKLWTVIKSKINQQLGGNDMLDMTNGLRPYTFRHNFCCECYYRKITILKTAELMGNSPNMVMKIYAHLDNSKEPIRKLKKLCL